MTDLPIDDVLGDVAGLLGSSPGLVVVAPPGAGKTTRLPPAIARLTPNQEVWVLEPRRLAARWAAVRMAAEMGEDVGQTVGYQVRFDRRLSSETRIRVVTEGILTRRIIDDPFLDGVAAVVIDEFHERSVDADLALALLRESQTTVRPDLRVVVMSATIDPEPVRTFLGDCPVIRSEGRAHRVAIEYRPPDERRRLEEEVAAAVRGELRRADSGDILVFLPGMREIQRTAERLRTADADVRVLHGSLSLTEQEAALTPSALRRVVLSTNVAESSLTVEGVKTVVDSGLERRAEYDPGLGVDRLQLAPIGRFSADQRAGRAGRTQPGRAVRLWSDKTHALRSDAPPPEIARVDAAPVVLSVLSYAAADPLRFGWFEAPAASRLRAALALLRRLGAIEQGGFALTARGRTLARLPLHPRWGVFVLAAAELGATECGLDIAALAESRESAGSEGRGRARVGLSDLLELRERGLSAPARRSRKQLARVLRAAGPSKQPTPEVSEEQAILRATWAAFPDRLGRVDDGRRVSMAGGSAELSEDSVVSESKLIAAVRIDERRGRRVVRWASHVEVDWIDPVVHGLERFVGWTYLHDEARVAPVEELRMGDLIVQRKSARERPTTDPGEVLAEVVRRDLDRALPRSAALDRLVARYRFARDHVSELELSPLPDDVRTLLVDDAVRGQTRLADLSRIDLAALLRARLPQGAEQRLAEAAPDAWRSSSGRVVKLRYDAVQGPVLSAKLQELFGLRDTPRLARGRVPVTVELLAPNQRPVQVTKDLESFWKTTYAEVRKELRRRYPKHAWPEDPKDGDATKTVKRRRRGTS